MIMEFGGIAANVPRIRISVFHIEEIAEIHVPFSELKDFSNNEIEIGF